MAKGRKQSGGTKGRKITLKMAKNALKLTLDGKRRLDLSNMEISTFPKCLLQLCDVDELDLSRNLLQKVPESLDKFFNLRYLDLHSNYLEQIPEGIGHLQNLLTLNLCNNRLTASGVPHELGLLKKLRNLNLGMNQLETLPPSISTLKELRQLGLFNNLLTEEPHCLQKLPNLQAVNIKGNPITAGKPADLDPIKRVECLYLVREGSLCAACLQRCKEGMERVDSRRSGGPVLKRSMFTGLITPNSVTKEDEAMWR